MKENNLNGNFSAKALDKEERNEAKKANIPPGKYAYIQNIIELDPAYNIDELKNMKMKDLKKLYENLANNQTKKKQ